MSSTYLLVAAARGNVLSTNRSSAPMGMSTLNEYTQIIHRGYVIMQELSLVLEDYIHMPYDLRFPLLSAAQQQALSRSRRRFDAAAGL